MPLGAPRVPRPRRIGIDDRESFAGFGERDQIIDRAAVLDNLAVPLLARAISASFTKRCDAVIGALARALDLGFETVRVERGEPLPARGFVLLMPRSESFEVAGCDFIFLRTARSPRSAMSDQQLASATLGAHSDLGRLRDQRESLACLA